MEFAIAILGCVCAFLALVVLVLLGLYHGAIRRLGEASGGIADAERRYGEASEGYGNALQRNYALSREHEALKEKWDELVGLADELRGIGQAEQAGAE